MVPQELGRLLGTAAVMVFALWTLIAVLVSLRADATVYAIPVIVVSLVAAIMIAAVARQAPRR
jgi:peptidoglycan/LPS O-acetylase OafA/YrhL